MLAPFLFLLVCVFVNFQALLGHGGSQRGFPVDLVPSPSRQAPGALSPFGHSPIRSLGSRATHDAESEEEDDDDDNEAPPWHLSPSVRRHWRSPLEAYRPLNAKYVRANTRRT